MAYQDAWIGRDVAVRGERSCADRYELIKPVVAAYRRQVTLWDLGANMGYFGCRFADEHGAISIMVDSRPGLVSICRANGLPTTVAMTHRLSVADLRELAASECPDVVLALNVIHHFEDWRGALEAVCQLGETVIIETPGRGDRWSANYANSQLLLDAIEALEPDMLGETPSHVTPGVMRPIYCLRTNKAAVTSGYCYRDRVRARGPHPVRAHRIESSRDDKRIVYRDGEDRPWYPGLNLWNWLQLGGSYPAAKAVCRSVSAAADGLKSPHGDLRPWNMILQGQAVQLIDSGHRNSVADTQGLALTLDWIMDPKQAYVRGAA